MTRVSLIFFGSVDKIFPKEKYDRSNPQKMTCYPQKKWISDFAIFLMPKAIFKLRIWGGGCYTDTRKKL